MPTYERRFFLGLLNKEAREREEKIEEIKNNQSGSTSNSKGTRKTRVGGEALKTRMKTGDIPIT